MFDLGWADDSRNRPPAEARLKISAGMPQITRTAAARGNLSREQLAGLYS